MEQLLLVTSCDSPAGIGASLRTDERTNEQTDGWTDRRDVGNSILDWDEPKIGRASLEKESILCEMNFSKKIVDKLFWYVVFKFGDGNHDHHWNPMRSHKDVFSRMFLSSWKKNKKKVLQFCENERIL